MFIVASALKKSPVISYKAFCDLSTLALAICHHGIRSMQVARYFDSIGFERIINLQGGIDAWAKKIDNSMIVY
jgi:rhodanese-related sulfurtransferase